MHADYWEDFFIVYAFVISVDIFDRWMDDGMWHEIQGQTVHHIAINNGLRD